MEIVLRHLGFVLLIFSLFPVVPFVAALYYGGPFLPFLTLAAVSALLGMWLVRREDSGGNLSVQHFDLPRSIALSALSFIVLSVLGTVPYLMMTRMSFLDAFFESVSGFTTTGLTVLMDVESVSRPLLVWRAETQWIGGLGVVLLFLLIVSAMRRQDSLKESTTKARAIANLYQAQGASAKLHMNMSKSIKHTTFIYLGYTLVGIALLYVVGLSSFEAVSIAFTAISTGGFSVTNTFYTSWPVLIVLIFLMVAGSVSWVLHSRFFRGYFRDFFGNRSFIFYLALLILAVIGVFAFTGDLKASLFEATSAISTTSYSISDMNALPPVVVFIIMCCMMIGGMIGSTAGGIKIIRFRMLLKSIVWTVRKSASPSGAIIPLKMDGKPAQYMDMVIIHAFTAAYMLVLFVGTGILMITGLSFLDSSFQTVSALGVVGLSTTSPALFHPVAKVVLIVAMLFGRLEIFPLLVLLKLMFGRIRRRIRARKEESRKLFYMMRRPSGLWKRRS